MRRVIALAVVAVAVAVVWLSAPRADGHLISTSPSHLIPSQAAPSKTRLVVTGVGDIAAYSDDNGATWTSSNTGLTGLGKTYMSVGYLAGKFVLWGTANAYSADGLTWTAALTPNNGGGAGTGGGQMVCNTTYCCAMAGGGGNGVWRTSDGGVTWSNFNTGTAVAMNRSVSWSSGNGLFLAGGNDSGGTTNVAAVSSDCSSSWTQRAGASRVIGGFHYWTTMGRKAQYVIWDSGGGAGGISNDSVTWSFPGTPFSRVGNGGWNGSVWCVGDNAGNTAVAVMSSAGWTPGAYKTLGTGTLFGCYASGTRLIAYGLNIVYYSDDNGTTWTPGTIPAGAWHAMGSSQPSDL